MQVVFTKLAYNYNKEFGEANATLSAHGSVSFFVKSTVNIDRLFLTSLVQFSSDGTDNFDINFTNKTVDICKLSRNPRYEPLIQLVFKILSEKVHLPRCPVKKVYELFFLVSIELPL